MFDSLEWWKVCRPSSTATPKVERVATTVVLVQKQMPINPGIMMTTEISQVQYVDKEALVIKHVTPARVATFNPVIEHVAPAIAGTG